MTNKLHADTKGTSYTYTPDGKLVTRTWARGVVTTYAYDSSCGAMTNITYSDSTPSFACTYDRLGRQSQITDTSGLRTFQYDPDTLGGNWGQVKCSGAVVMGAGTRWRAGRGKE